jgi:hypothetical protein
MITILRRVLRGGLVFAIAAARAAAPGHEISVDRQAMTYVMSSFLQSTLVACGKHTFVYARVGFEASLLELVNPRFVSHAATSFTQADHLNGIDYRAVVSLEADVQRRWDSRARRWEPWEDINSQGYFQPHLVRGFPGVYVEHTNGRWSAAYVDALLSAYGDPGNPHVQKVVLDHYWLPVWQQASAKLTCASVPP